MRSEKGLARVVVAKRTKGFTLVEVLVALALLAIVGVGLIAALGGASKVLSSADSRETARDLAQAQMESIQNQPYQSTSPDYAEIAAPAGYVISTSASPLEGGLQQITVIVRQGSEERFTLIGRKVNW